MAPERLFALVPDLLPEPLARRGGGNYQGRFQIPEPQWLLNPDDLHATTAVSIRDIATAVANRLVWTDQRVQRGIRPEREGDTDVELCLDDGYPDTARYIFYPDKADDIASKLLAGQQRLHLSPLVWNLRPNHFQAALDEAIEPRQMYLYRGRIYLPDGHHRHQAVVKAFRAWEEAEGDFPDFDPDRQLTLDIYFMPRQEEAEYFFSKNVLSRSVERSKSFDLTEQDTLSVLAKQVIEKAPSLARNVNRVTDRLSASNPQVITLSTLREMMKAAVGDDELTQTEIGDLSTKLAAFYEALAAVRPELKHMNVDDRRSSRRVSMASQAVVMFGYAELMRRFLEDASGADLEAALVQWSGTLEKLGPKREYRHTTGWTGDFFQRSNPLWREIGVLQETKSGGETVSNVRQTRDQAAKALVELLEL